MDASRTPYKIKADDGEEYRVSTQGSVAIRKLRVGDRVELEYVAGEWYAFPNKGKTEGRMGTMKDVFEQIDEAMATNAPPTAARVLYAIMQALKCSAEVANKIYAVYSKEKIVKMDTHGSDWTTSHGGFMETDVLERAIAMHDANEAKYKKYKASDDMVKRADAMMKEGW